MSIHKVVTGVFLAGLLIAAAGCNETHALKKKAMVEHWEKSTANARLPVIENMIEQGRIEEAKKDLLKCLQADPENAQVFVLTGRVHAIEGRNDQARTAFKKAVELDDQSDQAWYFLGSLAVLEKDYGQALECYQKAVALMPAKADYIICLLGGLFLLFGVDQQTIDAGLSLQPQNLQLMLSKAQLCRQTGLTDEAVRIYEQALIIHGNLPEVLDPAGYLYVSQKQWSKAADMFKLLMKQYTEDDPRYLWRSAY